MASAVYAQDLTCSICLSLFSDPLTLLCGHSFCRKCVTGCLVSQCPQCRASLPSSEQLECLPTSLILKNLCERAKEETQRGRDAAQWLCPDHDEKLKLFCVTDQQLTCIICRDGEKHEGHKFKPVKEAAASLRKELEWGMENLPADVVAIESLANQQREEITKTRERSRLLTSQVRKQFEEMHQFLRKREDEIKNELRNQEEDTVEEMTQALNSMETALTENRELEVKCTAVQNITDPETFLKYWTEGDVMKMPEHLFRPRAGDLHLKLTSLFLGPYESHLQFFMWKEMLQVIQPRAEQLSLRNDNNYISVSDDRRSLFCAPKSIQNAINFTNQTLFGQPTSRQDPYQGLFSPVHNNTYNAFSTNDFTSGQSYWEVEVRQRNYWELGIKDYFLKYENSSYAACNPKTITELTLPDTPRNIGIYLDCSSKKLSFYDADNMTRLHTLSCGQMSVPVSAYFNIAHREPDFNPLTVCWY